MTDILDLHGWEVTGSRQEDGEYIITAKHTTQPEACMKCGVIVLPNNAVGSQAVEAVKALKAAYATIGGICPSCLGSFELEEVTLRASTLLCKKCADRAI